MTAEDLDIIISSVAPVMREFVAHKIQGLRNEHAALLDVVAELEKRFEKRFAELEAKDARREHELRSLSMGIRP